MPPIVFIDFEGTGTDPYTDRIVEACFHGALFTYCTRVNPCRPIPAEATAVHGITDDDVFAAPTFGEIAPKVQALVTGAALCGYSIRRYDTLLLDAELRRAGLPGLERDAAGRILTPEIDLFELWQRHEPRTLVGAARRFADVELGEAAHSAEADTLVLPALLDGMRRTFGLPGGVDELARLSVPDGCVDRDRKFLRREDGVVVFNFSQSKGRPVLDNPGLLSWMLRRDFSLETREYARAFLDEAYAAEGVDVAGRDYAPW